MKAEYILDAIEAMQAAENHLRTNFTMESASLAGRLQAELFCARTGLIAASGLGDIQIKIEKPTA